MVGLVVCAGYVTVWYLAVERPTCEQTGAFACAGPGILMYVVGVPVSYVLWSLGLRVVWAPLPWLAPLAVLAVLIVLVPLSEPIEPPLWMWPGVVALLCVAWARGLVVVFATR